jgi:hypothetical protein
VTCNHSNLFLDESLLFAISFDNVLAELVKADLFGKHVDGNGGWPTQPSARLIIVQDGVEAGPIPVEKVLVAGGVVVPIAFGRVAEQRVRKPGQRPQPRLEPQPADVEDNFLGPRAASDASVGVAGAPADVVAADGNWTIVATEFDVGCGGRRRCCCCCWSR